MIKNREGFWATRTEPRLPTPVAQIKPWKGKAEFLRHLGRVESIAEKTLFRGFSTCRICGHANGSAEYATDHWEWPNGFGHYISDHNVEPTPEFKAYIDDLAIAMDRARKPQPLRR